MAQKLGEWANAPAEATGLYRAVLLRSGKWELHHHPLQIAAPLVLPSLALGFFFPSFHSFDVFSSLLTLSFRFFFLLFYPCPLSECGNTCAGTNANFC